jgi:dTDP-4-dehydrorhamnose 3,5-epimerase
MFVPVGFGHGFVTLTDNAEVAYKASDYYTPQAETGVVWDDPDLAIDWPLAARAPVLSERDQRFPRLKDVPAYFRYQSGH